LAYDVTFLSLLRRCLLAGAVEGNLPLAAIMATTHYGLATIMLKRLVVNVSAVAHQSKLSMSAVPELNQIKKHLT
jgi:hypothetical protein